MTQTNNDIANRYTISNIETPDVPDSDNVYLIDADVTIDGRVHRTQWAALEQSNGSLGSAGWSSCDEWVDSDIAKAVGDDMAVRIGAEIFAMASQARR